MVYEATGFDTILLASGSEVNLAVKAAKELEAAGTKVRVVFCTIYGIRAQDAAYKEEILPNAVRRRVTIEMAANIAGTNMSA